MSLCLETPPSFYAMPDASGFDMLAQFEAIRQARQAGFESFLTKEFPAGDVKSVLVQGDPAGEIVAYARDNNVDLIMMPTHGHGPLRRFLLGSVTAKVLHDSDAPVWTGAHTTELRSHTNGHYGHILCAVDVDTSDIPVIQWAAEFARKEGAGLRLIHAVAGAASRRVESDQLVRAELFKLARQGIEDLQKAALSSFELIVRGGKPEIVVHDAVQDLGADLVVIGRGVIQGAFGRLRSHAYSIIRESPCPVISI